jgi:hypothetical protein
MSEENLLRVVCSPLGGYVWGIYNTSGALLAESLVHHNAFDMAYLAGLRYSVRQGWKVSNFLRAGL